MKTDLFMRARGYAARLRFPKLVALTLGILAVDLLIPDMIPFVDEILLALVTALLASFKKKRREAPPV